MDKKTWHQNYTASSIKLGGNLAFTHLYNYYTAAWTLASLVFPTNRMLKPEDASLQVKHQAELPVSL